MHAPRGPRPTSVGVVVAAEFVPASVLDASALLAWLQSEQGADLVVDALAAGTVISVFNWVEALSKIADTGRNPETLVRSSQGSALIERRCRSRASPAPTRWRSRGSVDSPGPVGCRYATAPGARQATRSPRRDRRPRVGVPRSRRRCDADQITVRLGRPAGTSCKSPANPGDVLRDVLRHFRVRGVYVCCRFVLKDVVGRLNGPKRGGSRIRVGGPAGHCDHVGLS